MLVEFGAGEGLGIGAGDTGVEEVFEVAGVVGGEGGSG